MSHKKIILLCAALVAATPSARAADASPGEALHRLMERAWERRLVENPTFASELGEPRYNRLWPDRSLAAIYASHEKDQQVLRDLAEISRDGLSGADRINYDLFGREYRERAEAFQFRQFLIPLNQREGIQSINQLGDRLSFAGAKDYEAWIARLRALPRYVEQTIALMRVGISEGRVHPRVIMERIPAQIEAQLVERPEDSPFFTPLGSFRENISATERARLKHEARAAIAAAVVPAYQEFYRFFVDTYLPACRESV